MSLADGFDDHFLGDLVGAGFNHQDSVAGAADHHAQSAFSALCVGGMQDVFAVQVGDPARSDGSVEWNLGD